MIPRTSDLQKGPVWSSSKVDPVRLRGRVVFCISSLNKSSRVVGQGWRRPPPSTLQELSEFLFVIETRSSAARRSSASYPVQLAIWLEPTDAALPVVPRGLTCDASYFLAAILLGGSAEHRLVSCTFLKKKLKEWTDECDGLRRKIPSVAPSHIKIALIDFPKPGVFRSSVVLCRCKLHGGRAEDGQGAGTGGRQFPGQGGRVVPCGSVVSPGRSSPSPPSPF